MEETVMNIFRSSIRRKLSCMLVMTMCILMVFARQGAGILQGRVLDENDAVVAGAKITLTDAKGRQKTAVSNSEGEYRFEEVAPGKHTLRASAKGFAVYEDYEVEMPAGKREPLNIRLY